MKITNPGRWPAGRTELERLRAQSSMKAYTADVINLATALALLAPEPASTNAGTGRQEIGEEPEECSPIGLRLVD
jgi:hypothetical protein